MEEKTIVKYWLQIHILKRIWHAVRDCFLRQFVFLVTQFVTWSTIKMLLLIEEAAVLEYRDWSVKISKRTREKFCEKLLKLLQPAWSLHSTFEWVSLLKMWSTPLFETLLPCQFQQHSTTGNTRVEICLIFEGDDWRALVIVLKNHMLSLWLLDPANVEIWMTFHIFWHENGNDFKCFSHCKNGTSKYSWCGLSCSHRSV